MSRMAAVVFLLLGGVVAGCRGTPAQLEFAGDFEEIAVSRAPARLQAHFEQVKAVPGLSVFRAGDESYLLLCAGLTEGPGFRLEVLEVRPTAPGGKEARVLAALRRGSDPVHHPCTVVVLRAPPDLAFKARLNTESQGVVELYGIPVSDR